MGNRVSDSTSKTIHSALPMFLIIYHATKFMPSANFTSHNFMSMSKLLTKIKNSI